VFCIGLFKKVVIADTFAIWADAGFDSTHSLTFFEAWGATLSYTFQLYYDFSGYTDMAIGAALFFNITLPINFNSPYKAVNIQDFWRRWHITLSNWLRDYIYIPLGGNRLGEFRTFGNIAITFLIGGLWHGAAWTYVIWGGLHGLYLCINHGWRALTRSLGLSRILSGAAVRPLYIGLTFLAWSFALVVFRSPDMATANHIILSTLAPEPGAGTVFEANFQRDGLLSQFVTVLSGMQLTHYGRIYLVLAIASVVCFALPNTQQILARFDPVLTEDGKPVPEARFLSWRPGPVSAVATALMLSLGLLSLSSVTEFIYFQF